jgi:hypothetical protein
VSRTLGFRVLEQVDQRCAGLFAAGLPGEAAEGVGRAVADLRFRVLEQGDQRSDGLFATGLPGKAAEGARPRSLRTSGFGSLSRSTSGATCLFAAGLPGKVA